jgi:hypothetical protein
LRWGLAPILGALLIAGPAWADAGFFSPADVSGMADLRLSMADGERSWLDQGFGKTRVGGAGSGFAGHASLANAYLAWTPHLTWDLGAVIVGQYQSDHDRAPALGEAYLTYRPTPHGDTRFLARLGLFYPPVSQEHQGPAWIDTDMLTPSAINSWIGEEVKVAGAEIAVRHSFGEQELAATAGAFGYNDTAGTLLTTRGWALSDVQTDVPGRYVLPPLSAFMEYVQAPVTTPVKEIDHKVGGYGRIDWRINDRLTVNAFYYDNAGNLIGEDKLEWAWDTRFWNFGASLELGDHTRILSQVMIGDTRMGYAHPDIWVDTRFDAAYLLITHRFGEDALSARFDVFETINRAEEEYGDTREHGWAITADYRKRLSPHANVLVEAMHVSSDRPARTDIVGDKARQDQTVLQAALRLSF